MNFSFKSCSSLFLILLLCGCHTGSHKLTAGLPDKAFSGKYNEVLAVANSPAAHGYSPVLSKSKTANSSYDFSGRKNRKIAYDTTLTISVADIRTSIKKSSDIAEKHRGFLVRSDDTRVNIKVPVKNAEQALTEIEKMGEVTSRSISARDVTSQHTDVKLRLDNLTRLQKRLSELLKKAERVEDILKIEKELARITSELERFKARLKLLELEIETVDIQLFFNAASPQQDHRRSIVPAAWIRDLGRKIFREDFSSMGNIIAAKPINLKLPGNFLILSGSDNIMFAADNSDNAIIVRKLTNIKDADTKFYTPLIKRQLAATGFANIKFSDGKNIKGQPYTLFSAERLDNNYFILIMTFEEGWIFRKQKIAVTELLCRKNSIDNKELQKFFESVHP